VAWLHVSLRQLPEDRGDHAVLWPYLFAHYGVCCTRQQMYGALFTFRTVVEQEDGERRAPPADGVVSAAWLQRTFPYWYFRADCLAFLRHLALFLCYNPVACPVAPGPDLCALDPYLVWDPPLGAAHRCRRYYSVATRRRLFTLLLVARRQWGTSLLMKPLLARILRHLMGVQLREAQE